MCGDYSHRWQELQCQGGCWGSGCLVRGACHEGWTVCAGFSPGAKCDTRHIPHTSTHTAATREGSDKRDACLDAYRQL